MNAQTLRLVHLGQQVGILKQRICEVQNESKHTTTEHISMDQLEIYKENIQHEYTKLTKILTDRQR